MTCSRFSLLKTWLMTTEGNFPPRGSSALSLLSMAAFHLIIYGRFWVITEGMNGSLHQLALLKETQLLRQHTL